MDPSEAVHRLLTQDTFHEVKSKREKKKETKEIPESRSRSVNNNPRSGARGGTDRGGRINSNQSSSNDYGVSHGRPVHKKENGANTAPTSSIAGSVAGSNLNRKPTMPCEAVPLTNTTHASAVVDDPSLPSQPSSGSQHNWSRMPGQLSMADIVRMGRPQIKLPASTPSVSSDMFHVVHDPTTSNVSPQNAKQPSATITPSESPLEYHTYQGPVPQDEERSYELGGIGHYNSHDDWSLVGETSLGSGSTHPEMSGASIYADQSVSSSLLVDEANLEPDTRLDENQVQEDVNGDCLPTESIRSASISDGQEEMDNSGNTSHLDDGQLNGMYHSQIYAFEHHEVEDDNEEISSVTANLRQLNLQKGEIGVSSADDNPAVIIPDHLQVTDADCSHLSFGSFGPGGNPMLSGSFPVDSLGSNLEASPVAEDAQLDELNSRNPEYYDGDHLKTALDENVTSRTSSSTRSFDMPSSSQPEVVRDDTLDSAHGLQGNFPSVSDYAFSATTQPTATYTYPDPNSQMQTLSPLSSLMQTYTNSLPSSLLAPPVQPLREFDLPFSALLASQSMPTKYNTAPSISGAMSMPEVKPEVFSAAQPTQQALPSSSIHNAGGPALPQHLPMHPYSQPSLPLGHFANMIGYPFLPQSYTFLPSAAFPQAYTSNSPFHQSPATAMKYSPLPQYKSSISGTSLPQSPALPPGYGGLTGLPNSVPGSFSLNPSTASVSSAMGFDDALSSQYKDGSHYLPLQHNESSAMWLHGAGSRTVSALPGNTFYGFQGQQNQQNGNYRQAQQHPSQYGQMSYLNMYQSQGGPAQEQHQHQHQQNPSEGNMSGHQGPASHQMWQHGY